MAYVLEHGEKPKSVFAFVKTIDLKESEFYAHFPSFEVLEKSIFTTFFNNTITLLHKNEEYNDFEAKDKLLSFYFTFFELLTANRSYVVYALSGNVSSLQNIKVLLGLKKEFKKFVAHLDLPSFNLPIKQLEEIQEKTASEMTWGHFMFVLKFWLNDESPSFEKTDVLIEKSINTGISLVQSSPFHDVVDLGKFLFKETIKR